MQSGGTWSFTTVEVKAYSGRLIGEGVPSGGGWSWTRIATDRLSSVRSRGGVGLRYYPYGEERGGATGEDRTKFATYWRESGTGLDYADQRYYVSGFGRFATADPYRASASLFDPGSWNRYPYVVGDPVNRFDPSGLDYEIPNGQQFDPSDERNVPPNARQIKVTAPMDPWFMPQNSLTGSDQFEGPITQCWEILKRNGNQAYGELMWSCAQWMYPGNPLYDAAVGGVALQSAPTVEECTAAQYIDQECDESAGLAIALPGAYSRAAGIAGYLSIAWHVAARIIGMQGEGIVSQATGLTKNYTQLPGSTRIPDFVSHATRTIIEVKHVGGLNWTQQLNDMLIWARSQPVPYTMEIWVNANTVLSAEVVRLQAAGTIVVNTFRWP